MTTRTEMLEEADRTRRRELDREEANLIHNIKHAKTAEDRQRATEAYEIWFKHTY